MTKYIDQERARYWPVFHELLAQYKDGTHTTKDRVGTLYWTIQNSQRHRDDDKPALIGADGTLHWCQNGLIHRDGDKPGIIYVGGTLVWCQNNQLHRSRGPAQIFESGELEWWIYGAPITQEVNDWLNGEEWHGTPEQIFEFQLRFS